MTDKIKLVLSALLAVAGIAVFYWLGDRALVIRLLALLVLLGAALGVIWTTQTGQSAFSFMQDSVAEAKRVSWPSRKETVQTTMVVFGLVLVMAVFLWIVDVGFLWMVKQLMGRGV
jgi:preprotein translocase subunit SecE